MSWIRARRIDTPLGALVAAASERGIVSLSFAAVPPSTGSSTHGAQTIAQHADGAETTARADGSGPDDSARAESALDAVEAQLGEYLAGARRDFDLPLDLRGLTPFRRAVLDAISELGFGAVSTYAEVARQVGRPGGSRAVGGALAANPIAIVVPCHRVVRSDRTLGGYAGGLDMKRRLLGIEGWSEAEA